MSSPLFGLIPSGHPCITEPSQILSPTSFLYSIPPPHPSTPSQPVKNFTHVTVFLLPGVALPPDTGAAIYLLSNPPTPGTEKFAGAIGPGKESTLLKIGTRDTVVIGILIEPAQSLLEKVAAAAAAKDGTALAVPANASAAANTTTTSSTGSKESGLQENVVLLGLAEKIIGNAFNYLASFSVDAGNGQGAVVPLKAFEEWWKKFQTRARSDPKFLENV